MGDERLRALERRWRGSGTIEDEAAYLLERVRAGELERRGLGLAAHLGHPAARAACPEGRPFPDFSADEEDALGRRRLLRPWTHRLVWLSRLAGRRAAVASARHALPYYEAVYPGDAPRRAVEEADRLTSLGRDGDEGPLLEDAASAWADDTEGGLPSESYERAINAAGAAAAALKACLPGVDLVQEVFEALVFGQRACDPSSSEAPERPCDWSTYEARRVSSAEIVRVVQQAVVPWALGERLPPE